MQQWWTDLMSFPGKAKVIKTGPAIRRSPSGAISPWLPVVFFGLLVLAVAFYWQSSHGSASIDEQALPLIAVTCLISAGRLAWIIASGRPRLFELTFWTFVYVFLVLAPIVQFSSGDYPSTTPAMATGLNFSAMTVVLIGCMSAVVGISSGKTGQVASAAAGVHKKRTWILVAASLAINAYYVAKIGPSNFFATRDQLTRVMNMIWPNTSTAALIHGVATMPLLVAFGALLQLRRQEDHGRRLSSQIPLWIVAGALLVSVNPISGARYYFGTVALSLAAMLGAYATPARVRRSALAFILGLIFIFPVADIFRHTETFVIDRSGPVASMTSGDFDAIDQINNTVRYVEDRGVTYGRQALGPVLFWVPRSVWPDKPTDSGILIAKYRGYSFENLSEPLFAELFINGGWIALIVGMVMVGRLLHRGDSQLASDLAGKRSPGVLNQILPFYLVILLRGSLLQATALLVVLLVCTAWVKDREVTALGIGTNPESNPGRQGIDLSRARCPAGSLKQEAERQ